MLFRSHIAGIGVKHKKVIRRGAGPRGLQVGDGVGELAALPPLARKGKLGIDALSIRPNAAGLNRGAIQRPLLELGQVRSKLRGRGRVPARGNELFARQGLACGAGQGEQQ